MNTKPKTQKPIDYVAKLAANEAAMKKWTRRFKLASGKIDKLSAQRARIIKAKAGQEAAKETDSAFNRKFTE